MAGKSGGRPGGGKRSRPARGRPGKPFSWEGGPGYRPIDPAAQLPHAPMPGAPPYPAAEALPPTGLRPAVPYSRALAGAAVWAVVALLLVVLFGRPDNALGWVIQLLWIAICTAGASWPTHQVARKRGWTELWRLALIAFPAFWFLRALTSILTVLLLT
jgi:hypothetical protein